MKLAIPDLISNSYFPALAAAELGFFEREGLDVTAELIFPVNRAYEALRDGAVDFGLTAAQALQRGEIDGFWANGMATEIAVTSGTGTIVLDVRRGDGPPGCFDYTMPVLATTDRLIERSPETAAAALRALVATQNALKADASLATQAGKKRFPPREAGLIAGIVERDLPFYNAAISERSVAGINDFVRRMSILDEDVPYADIVAVQFRDLWRSGT